MGLDMLCFMDNGIKELCPAISHAYAHDAEPLVEVCSGKPRIKLSEVSIVAYSNGPIVFDMEQLLHHNQSISSQSMAIPL